MELRLYLSILRRRWWLVAGIPLLVALISGVVALAQPARYGTTARLLVTRSAAFDSTTGLTDQSVDMAAGDMPAIISGAMFRRDLAQELARRSPTEWPGGRPPDETALKSAIQASSEFHVITISTQATRPEDAVAIAQAAIDLIQRNGLHYWGDQAATPEHPGLKVGMLDPPGQGARLNGARAIALDVALRTLLGLVAGIGAAFVLHYSVLK